MMKEFVKNNNTIWYDILPKLIRIYNNRFHNTIKDKPININKSNEKYNIKWSEELFKIHSINKSNVITYKITDMNNEIIQGIFYEKELQLSRMKDDSLHIFEKIIRKVGDRYLIRWRNYSNHFNSWINKNDIVKYV